MMSVAKTKASWNIGAKMGTSPVLVGSFNSFLAKYWERAPTARLAMDFLKNQQVSSGPAQRQARARATTTDESLTRLPLGFRDALARRRRTSTSITSPFGPSGSMGAG